MNGRDSRQGYSTGLRVANHHHAFSLPELNAVDGEAGCRRHRELHATARGLVARLLHHAGVGALVPELGRELVDGRQARPRRDVPRERREVHSSDLKPTFSCLRALTIKHRQ